MLDDRATYLNLNTGGRWEGFHQRGLELGADGALRLETLPRLAGLPAEGLESLKTSPAPAGLARLPDGVIFYSQPELNRIVRLPACRPAGTGAEQPDPAGCGCPPCEPSSLEDLRLEAAEPGACPTGALCIGSYGSRPGQFDQPRGLLYHPGLQTLLVADSGNQRIQSLALSGMQVVDVWGGAGAADGKLDRPWALAADPHGNVFVVDWGNRRVQKLDLDGRAQPEFWRRLQATAADSGVEILEPVDVALDAGEGEARLAILDRLGGRILVCSLEGDLLGVLTLPGLNTALALEVIAGRFYVGDNGSQRISVIRPDGSLAGRAYDYPASAAALASGAAGELLALPGGELPPHSLRLDGGRTAHGFVWGGPFSNISIRREEWHLLKASIAAAEGAHFQLYVYPGSNGYEPAAENGAAPWSPAAYALAEHLPERLDHPAGKDAWVAIPYDTPEAVFRAMTPMEKVYGKRGEIEGQQPLDCIWVGMEFWSEGRESPALSQIRLDFDHVTYLQYLPQVFDEEAPARQTLGRFLALFESQFSAVENRIGGLPALFDPAAAPPEFLPWMASWLGFPLREDWPLRRRRSALAQAFESYGRRGTAQGLAAAIRLYTGGEVVIEEPLRQTGWWALPAEGVQTGPAAEASILGFSTYLAAVEPHGAAAGANAILDGSHLVSGDEAGSPLFMDLAHRFTVRMYRGPNFSDNLRREVLQVIEREKPAHTDAHLCLVEPAMRIGIQARLGIDAIIAGPPAPGQTPEGGLALPGDPPARMDGETPAGVSLLLEA